MSTNSKSSNNTSSSEDDTNELRRGPWTVEEDTLLIHYITRHGEGRWNLLAKRSGLRRTGKSCRLRWLNYLKPDVKRGNLTPEEQILILDLHSKWGNRWSKIAQYLPGRTDNEIKNYWRTRVQKQAKHLKIDTESAAFQDIIRRFWMPRLLQKIENSSSSALFPIVQNSSAAPLPIDNASQQCYSSTQIFSGHGNLNMSGLTINEQSSDSESMNLSHISQFQDYPNGPFQPNFVNNNNGYNTVLEGCSYGCENNGSDSMNVSNQSTITEGGLENPVGDCHVSSNNWADNDFFAGMWNMEELWQYRS